MHTCMHHGQWNPTVTMAKLEFAQQMHAQVHANAALMVPYGKHEVIRLLHRLLGLQKRCMRTTTSGARRRKSVAVTPKAAVRAEPSALPQKAPPLSTLISVANSVASTPCAAIAQACSGCPSLLHMLHRQCWDIVPVRAFFELQAQCRLACK